MPVASLSPGLTHTLLQNIPYALPAVRVTLSSTNSTPSLQWSNTSDFTTNIVITLGPNSNSDVVGGFIRTTGAGGVDLTVKRA